MTSTGEGIGRRRIPGAILDVLPDMVLSVGSDGVIVSVDALPATFGARDVDLLGRSIFDLLDIRANHPLHAEVKNEAHHIVDADERDDIQVLLHHLSSSASAGRRPCGP